MVNPLPIPELLPALCRFLNVMV